MEFSPGSLKAIQPGRVKNVKIENDGIILKTFAGYEMLVKTDTSRTGNNKRPLNMKNP